MAPAGAGIFIVSLYLVVAFLISVFVTMRVVRMKDGKIKDARDMAVLIRISVGLLWPFLLVVTTAAFLAQVASRR